MNEIEQNINNQAEQLTDLPLNDERDEQAKGGSALRIGNELKSAVGSVDSTAGDLSSAMSGPVSGA